MSDKITTLWCSAPLVMTKRWLADGTIRPYDSAKNFAFRQHAVADIHGLADLLSVLKDDPSVCIIRGTPKAGATAPIRRLRENFDDVPLHAVLVEIDQYRPLLSDSLAGEEAAREYITECLPPQFHNASFVWQMSASAGAPGKEGQFRAHLWFFLKTPYDSPTLKAWAKSEKLPLDHSVFQTVQPHFVASPVFDEGVVDPIAERLGFWRGAVDAVDLRIDVEALDIRVRGARQRVDGATADDPIADWVSETWETWGALSNGGLLVSCPWEHEHSGGVKGDTSTVYFPAGSNGYAEGAFVCFHNSCCDRHKSDFLQAIGYTDSKFASLVVEEPKVQVNGTKVNGVHVHDPLILPPFKRDGNGNIITCLTNAQLAIDSPKVSPWALRYDVFKDAVMRAEWGSNDWRPFTDSDYTHLRITLEGQNMLGVGREMIRDSVHYVAQRNAFDTAVAWLDTLEWDGIPRIETFWIDHFGVVDDEAGYVRAVGRYTWTALAGRALQPGVQADMAPILTGRQGMRKSRGVLAMAPATDFATNMSFHEPEVERARKMRGKLVVELAELQGLKSRDKEEILAWVTRSEEHWTPKFMEMTTQYKRRFLMIATTNESDFLDDANGERRWLPLAVGRREGFTQVDTDALAAVRNQLWAEGKAQFLDEGIAWQDAERLAKDQHHLWKSGDEWRTAIMRWLDAPGIDGATPRGRKHLTVLDVAEGALNLPAKTLKHADQRRIARVLREEGYVDNLRRVGSQVLRVWEPVDYA